MQHVVQEMDAAGLIEKSDSPWCSPVVLVNKKDGSRRFYVDGRFQKAYSSLPLSYPEGVQQFSG